MLERPEPPPYTQVKDKARHKPRFPQVSDEAFHALSIALSEGQGWKALSFSMQQTPRPADCRRQARCS